MGIFDLFGFGNNKEKIVAKLTDGATIVDVRTVEEFRAGHIDGSINIPLHTLDKKLSQLKKKGNIVTCCLSGGRSGQAADYLNANGVESINGGGWRSLQSICNNMN
jgi:rhodanese-related sulfurtransferase